MINVLPFTPLRAIATKAADILVVIWGRINTWMIIFSNGYPHSGCARTD